MKHGIGERHQDLSEYSHLTLVLKPFKHHCSLAKRVGKPHTPIASTDSVISFPRPPSTTSPATTYVFRSDPSWPNDKIPIGT
jgi:hypothetical protein